MTDGEQALWRYELAADFRRPEPLSIPARRGFKRLWGAALAAVGVAKAEDAIPSLGEPAGETLADLAPQFDLATPAAALSRSLDLGDGGGAHLDVVIGPPGAEAQRVVSIVANQLGWADVSPPVREELATGGRSVDASLEELAAKADTPLVIEALEKWLARSARALPTLRRLLDALLARSAPTLIACDSWAWSYLRRTVGAEELLGPPWALAPLDGTALAEWFGPPLLARGLECRSAAGRDHGVIFSRESTTDGDDRKPEAPKPLVALAAAARGNPGLSLELWRRSLRLESAEGESSATAASGSNRIVWSALSQQLGQPAPPLEAVDQLLMHALFVHGGLDFETLIEVLPVSSHDVRRSARRLNSAGLVHHRDESLVAGENQVLAVALAHYDRVRSDLADEGFLVDDF